MPDFSPAAIRHSLRQNSDLLIVSLIIGIVLLIIIPLPPVLLDIFLFISISSGLVILLITMFTAEPLQFSVFPALLLVTTLYRLALNISSTRLILGQGEAGRIIQAFGEFVVGGNYVVGFIVFVIITVIQFVVITSGAGRVAEVAARFTLDAMPGKQMSIDAEFNAGLIGEEEARERRRRLQQEADFYGAMDGASKFVRGDAIAGIIITLINILAGITIGIVLKGMDVVQALQTYTILTIGDGLVAQIPAVLISTSAGILVTRPISEGNFGRDLAEQFSRFPRILLLAAVVLGALGLVPAMPNILFLSGSLLFGYLAYKMEGNRKAAELKQQEEKARAQTPRVREPENVAVYFQVDPLQVEIGYNLIALADENRGGDLLPRLAAVRRQCALEMGIYVRPIRIRDNLQLGPNEYIFRLRGEEGARGEVLPGYYMVMNPMGDEIPLSGIPARDPAFGLPAMWVEAAQREQAELMGLTVVDPSTVIVTHLTEFIKKHAYILLGRQEVKELLEAVKEKDPAVVEDLVPDVLSIGEVQKVLQNLLQEGVPLRDLVTILEALSDGVRIYGKDLDQLTEHVRSALARTICRQVAGADNRISVVTLHPRLEQTIAEAVQTTQWGLYPVLDPATVRRMLDSIGEHVNKFAARGLPFIILCSPRVRLPLRRLLERYVAQLNVLSLNEIASGYEVEVLGTVMID